MLIVILLVGGQGASSGGRLDERVRAERAEGLRAGCKESIGRTVSYKRYDIAGRLDCRWRKQVAQPAVGVQPPMRIGIAPWPVRCDVGEISRRARRALIAVRHVEQLCEIDDGAVAEAARTRRRAVEPCRLQNASCQQSPVTHVAELRDPAVEHRLSGVPGFDAV